MPHSHQTELAQRIDAKIGELRDLLISAKELDDVADYFHRVLVLDDAFIASGAPSSNPRLISALQAVLTGVEPEGKLGTALIIRLHEHDLCHGYLPWGRGHVVFFYFEQLDLGFCSYSRCLSAAEVTFVRFNLTNGVGAGAWGAWQSASAATSGPPQ